MFDRLKPLVGKVWLWFRSRNLFAQCLLVVPVICAIILTVLVGNMGLALMGGAIALYAPIVGWIGGVIALTFGKAATIILKDKRRAP